MIHMIIQLIRKIAKLRCMIRDLYSLNTKLKRENCKLYLTITQKEEEIKNWKRDYDFLLYGE